MDDPWANAWDEYSKPVTEQATTIASSWTVPSPSITLNHDDQEADITAPSWSVETDLQWTESDTETIAWNGESASISTWEPGPSIFAGIQLGKVSTPDDEISLQTTIPSVEVETLNLPSFNPLPIDNETFSSFPITETSSHPSTTPTPGSPDAFGTFETADGTTVAALGERVDSNKVSSVEMWNTSWGPTDPVGEVIEQEDTVDEWESAKQRKENQDKHVPPELLASILMQLEELSNQLWPDSVLGSTSSNTRHLDESFGLGPIQERLIPQQLTLPPYVMFSQTSASKQLAEALRLTRHAILSKQSPMSMYLASKGSTSWEASVKSRPELAQQDFTPPGWKIVEKEELFSTEGNKERPALGGGILSFFGRKANNPIVDETSRRSASPIRPTPSSKTTNNSPRGSVDSAQSAVNSGTSSTHAIGKLSASSPVNATFATSSISTAQESSILSPIFPNGVDPESAKETTPPPSAVSRFLGRFSRSSRPTSASRSQNSLSLSNDDLEFLSDVVPTIQDHVEHDVQLDALSSMIKSPPLPVALPPPLAPPPRFSQPKLPPQKPFRSSFSVPPSVAKQKDEDLFSLFDCPEKSALSSPVAVSNELLMSSALPQHNQSDDIWSSFNSLSVAPSSPAPIPPPKQQASTSIMPRISQKPLLTSKPLILSDSHRAIMSHNPTASSSTTLPPLLPPPPSSRAHTPLSTSIDPNLPSSRTHTPPVAPQQRDQQPVADKGDEDDFSDFLSSPARAIPPSFSNFNSLTPSKQITPFGNSLFDDFDFGTPSPPQPPAKSPSLLSNVTSSQLSSSPARATSPPKVAQSPPRVSRAADHQRTLSLLETAASRGGKWLGPPSPLPDALPPPGPPARQPTNTNRGLSVMQSQQAQAVARVEASMSSPPPLLSSRGPPTAWQFPPPPSTATLQPGSVSQPQNNASIRLPSAQRPLGPTASSSANPYTTPSTKTGGLSAQDLSFFEGL